MVGAHMQRRQASPLAAPGRLRIADRIVALFDACAASNSRAILFLLGLCVIAFLPGFFAIPPVDRDEARYAQISRQMVEGGRLTDTRLGLEAHHTRPYGIHWLQAGVVRTFEALGVPQATQSIAVYRLSSLGAGISVVLLTFWAALAFARRRTALMAATLLASTAAMGVAARLAIPEALLVAAITASMGAFARVYLAVSAGGRVDTSNTRLAVIFWGGFYVALMAKGVQAPVYFLLPVLALILTDRSARFLRPLAPLAGTAIFLLLAAFWFYLRHSISADSVAEAGERALAGRVAPFFTGFLAPPGVYFLLFWGLFWPAAPLAALAVPIIWKARRLYAVRCLLAWILPVWLLIEFLPTKIPAFVVPVFPAVAILIAVAMERGALALANNRLSRLLWLWPTIGAVIAVIALLGLAILDHTTSFLAWPLLLAGFFALVMAAASVRDYGIEKASLLAVAGMLVSGFGVMHLILPQMHSLWVPPRLVEAARAESCATADETILLGSAGYREPSLVFLAPGRVRFMDGAGAADFLQDGGCRVVFVERRQESRFVRQAEQLGLRIERGVDIQGFDYNAGRRVRLTLYRRAS